MNHRSCYARTSLVACLMCSFAALLPVTANASAEQKWNFTVYLDDTPIGHHDFSIRRAEGYEEIATHARFDVKFLKIPLFNYRHQNVEQWSNRCLKSISSTTDQNGKLFRVEGATRDEGFQVSTNDGDITLPPCISTFAYWDKSFLESGQLLNSQTGEYQDVEVDYLGEQPIPVRNINTAAH
ncbi:MAG: DUF6134 family protein, partial [Thiogranum sp.]